MLAAIGAGVGIEATVFHGSAVPAGAFARPTATCLQRVLPAYCELMTAQAVSYFDLKNPV
jgi:hypothetical protein